MYSFIGPLINDYDNTENVVGKCAITTSAVSGSLNLHMIEEATRVTSFNSEAEEEWACLAPAMKRSPMEGNLIQNFSSYQKRAKKMMEKN